MTDQKRNFNINYSRRMTMFDRDYAKKLDNQNLLKNHRNKFYVPENNIYFDGNSLGLLSKNAENALIRVLEEWKNLAIKGWLEGELPWFYMAEEIGKMAANIVGAKPEEIILSGTTTINIHTLISSFYSPEKGKSKILADELNFPSDLYALQGQIGLRGFNPDKDLLLVKSKDGFLLNEDDIVRMMNDAVNLVFLPSVLYRSGQLLDMEYLTRKAHERNLLIGFDCSHSAGTVPHKFHDWDVDFGLFCSYKYLNSGPGAAAFLYVNEKHSDQEVYLRGWFGYNKTRQFDLLNEWEKQPGAAGWQISSPGILGSAPVQGSLEIINEAGIENIRKESLRMTTYLIDLINERLTAPPYNYSIITPQDHERRGGHVAIIHEKALQINEALKDRGVIPDFRPPNVIRLAPIPLYNTFAEILQVATYLKEIIDTEAYKNYSDQRPAVS